MNPAIQYDVLVSDVRRVETDVLALKYSDVLMGAGEAVASAMGLKSVVLQKLIPDVGLVYPFPSGGKISASQVLFMHTQDIDAYDYDQARLFGKGVTLAMMNRFPELSHLSMIVPGADFGLEADRAFESQWLGCEEAFKEGPAERALKRISFVDREQKKVDLYQQTLARLEPKQVPCSEAGGPTPRLREACGTSPVPVSRC